MQVLGQGCLPGMTFVISIGIKVPPAPSIFFLQFIINFVYEVVEVGTREQNKTRLKSECNVTLMRLILAQTTEGQQQIQDQRH